MRSIVISAFVAAAVGLTLQALSGEKPPPGALKAGVKKGAPVDNSRCFVCHLNYDGEELATTHAKAGVSCEKCHGKSDAHAADEDNVTPPEIMYAKAKLNAACLKCHDAAKLDSDDHVAAISGTAKRDKYCTDCHGEHQLKNRSRNWDKETGRLLPKAAAVKK